MKSYHEWKDQKGRSLSEFQLPSAPTKPGINFRKLGQGFGDATSIANPKFMSYLKPRIDGLWRLVTYKAEKDNPGSMADPGRLRQLQDEFIRDLMTTITKLVRGDEAGAGRSVNLNRRDMNTIAPTASAPPIAPSAPTGFDPQSN